MLLIANRPTPDQTEEGEVLRRRYYELVGLGYSPETSLIVSGASVPLESVTELILPDRE
jgi:hypothetical protein